MSNLSPPIFVTVGIIVRFLPVPDPLSKMRGWTICKGDPPVKRNITYKNYWWPQPAVIKIPKKDHQESPPVGDIVVSSIWAKKPKPGGKWAITLNENLSKNSHQKIQCQKKSLKISVSKKYSLKINFHFHCKGNGPNQSPRWMLLVFPSPSTIEQCT